LLKNRSLEELLVTVNTQQIVQDKILHQGSLTLSRLSDGRLLAELSDVSDKAIVDLRQRQRDLSQCDVPGLECAHSLETVGETVRVIWRAPGQHLAKRCEAVEDRSPEEKRLICWSLATSLAALHECGIAHGCLIPHVVWGKNYSLLLGAELGPWVMQNRDELGDEHLRYLPPQRDEGDSLHAGSPLTQTEQALQRTDLYALGMIMLEMFIGPDHAHEIVRSMRKSKGATRSISPRLIQKKSRTQLPKQWITLTCRLLAQDEKLTARYVADSLLAPQAGLWKRWRGVIAGFGAVGLLVIAFVFAGHNRSKLNEQRDINLTLQYENEGLHHTIKDWIDINIARQAENNRLRVALDGDRKELPTMPSSSPKDEWRRFTQDMWEYWSGRRSGTLSDLDDNRLKSLSEWDLKCGRECAKYINSRLVMRLEDANEQGQWQLRLGSIDNVTEERLWVRIEIDDRSAFKGKRVELVKERGQWVLPREYRQIVWRPEQAIRVRLERGTWCCYYTLIDETRGGPLALWQIAQVKGMGWPKEDRQPIRVLGGTDGPSMTIVAYPYDADDVSLFDSIN